MARVHKLLVTLGCGSALYSSLVPALGLGEITLHSALSQPLNAEIQLVEVGDLNANEIKVGLASVDEFNRAGVERVFFLNDLRFTPVIRGNRSYIQVASRKPISEPYLNFVVEIARPNGRLLREYTLLLDPPGSMPALPTSAISSSVSSHAANVSGRPPKTAAAPRVATVGKSTAGAPPPALAGKHHRVVNGDSLWSIAKQLRAAGSTASLDELMNGIFTLNPQAFSGGDRAKLKVGQDLLLPDVLANAAAQSTPAAVSGTDAPQSTATAPAIDGAPTMIDRQPAMPATAAQAGLDAAARQLNVAQQENLQLQQQLNDLQGQVDTLKDQVSDKDQQVAVLQNTLSQSTPAAGGASSGSNATGSPAAGMPATATAAAGSPAAAPAAAASAPGVSAAGDAGQVSSASSGTAPVNATATASNNSMAPAPSMAMKPKVAPTSIPVEKEQSSNGVMIFLLGILALIVALTGLVFVSRRNRRETVIVVAPVEPEWDEQQVIVAKAAPVATATPVVAPVVASAATVVAPAVVLAKAPQAPTAAPVKPQAAAEPAEDPALTATDSLDGASIYIAYGRYNEALAVLQDAIGREPSRLDLRLRLLDVFGHQNDAEGYATQEAAMCEMGFDEAQLVQLRTRYPKLATAQVSTASAAVKADSLAKQQSVEPVAAPASDEVDNFQLNLDELPLDADWDAVSPFAATPVNRVKAAADARAEAAQAQSNFHSNLNELPEVFELNEEQFLGEPEAPIAKQEDKGSLDDEFLDTFIAESDMFNSGAMDMDLDEFSAQENSTKLDLAQAYLEQGDVEGASYLLQEVIIEGDDELKQEARQLLARIA